MSAGDEPSSARMTLPTLEQDTGTLRREAPRAILRCALVLLAGAACACTAADVVDGERDGGGSSRGDLLMLRVEIPTCGIYPHCWRAMGVEAPATLVLEDYEGVERFALRPQEYSRIREIAELASFREAMADPEGWDCPAGAATDPALQVRYEGVDELRVVIAEDCFVSPDEPLHLYETLMQHLLELKNAHLSCPSAILPPATPEGPLPARALCFACFGQC